jgi:hypothetical protein
MLVARALPGGLQQNVTFIHYQALTRNSYFYCGRQGES